MPGLGLGVGARHRRQGTPSGLFFAGEQGVWYDPSDLSTLFQDAAGTTPVTAVEQPVGLMLDKSRGLVLGPELVTNGGFDTNIAGWTPRASGTTLSWVSGQLRINSGAGSFSSASQVLSLTVGRTYLVTAQISTENSATRTKISIVNNAATVVLVNSAETTSTLPTNVRLVFTATETNSRIDFYRNSASNTHAVFADNISVRELPGNHATQTTSTSRPVLKQDAGGQYYLKFDGVDDGMVTNSIDFTATDKMTVFAGVRKLSDAFGVIAELSASFSASPGTFLMDASFAIGSYGWLSKGTVAQGTTTLGHPAPVSSVITGVGDIAGDRTTTRINGTQSAQNTSDQGTGNYGNYPLYIGRRGGINTPFNGHLYSLIVRGAATTDTRIAQTESWAAKKTGVTL